MSNDISKLLTENAYPGRGIIMGLSPSGKKAVMAYFIMGRSENSRNRVFTEKDGGIITEAADPAKMQDPSLIIYAPVRRLGEKTIVTNGDQTDTIYDALEKCSTFEDALRTRTFEPDAPNFTPRISGIMDIRFEGASYKLSILKSANGDEHSARRFFYEYSQPVAGQGHFIHTYAGDGNPLPSFYGEPAEIAIPEDAGEFAKTLWASLNDENKVSLFVRSIGLDGDEETHIINKYTKI